jgi:hypothetical protein
VAAGQEAADIHSLLNTPSRRESRSASPFYTQENSCDLSQAQETEHSLQSWIGLTPRVLDMNEGKADPGDTGLTQTFILLLAFSLAFRLLMVFFLPWKSDAGSSVDSGACITVLGPHYTTWPNGLTGYSLTSRV